jgi:hypothetical protein
MPLSALPVVCKALKVDDNMRNRKVEGLNYMDVLDKYDGGNTIHHNEYYDFNTREMKHIVS